MLSKYPKIMPMPMAQNGNKNDIPLTTETAGLFTYNEGFPPITQVSVKAGGKAPQRNDFNGALNELSQHIFFLQAGGQYQWNAELDYNVGAVILGSDNVLYKSVQISGPSSGGAKDPTDPENTAYWEEIQSVKAHDADKNAHKDLFDKVLPFFTGDFKISFKNALDGFLLCDGSAVSRETYADLFAVIGTTFGDGDGSTTFNLPDFRGRFIQGAVQGEDGDLGSVKEAGLPNITGQIKGTNSAATCPAFYAGSEYSGALNLSKSITQQNSAGIGTATGYFSLGFDASDSNAIYGRSTTVQPPAVALNVFIKY